jgi:hypothetical protein
MTATFLYGREVRVARELEDVSVVNKQKLAFAELFKSVRESAVAPAPGPFLRFGESGAVTTNRGTTVREGKKPIK